MHMEYRLNARLPELVSNSLARFLAATGDQLGLAYTGYLGYREIPESLSRRQG
jgi:hypothetical protein